MADFEYDVFISYSSVDEAWAKKLQKSLTDSGLKVFLDSLRMVPAKEWEEQLYEALQGSKNIVLLWSDKARLSDWVFKETAYFDVTYFKNPERKFVCIVLNDQPKVFSRLQSINIIKDKELYEAGADAINNDTWDKIIARVLEGLKADDLRKPIRRAILTLTESELATLDFNWDPSFGKSLNKLDLTKEKIKNRYGPLRNDWKPFGGDKNIITVLDEILEEINKDNSLSYKWIPVNETRFWSDSLDDLLVEKQLLEKEPSVIIVDPVALYHQKVRDIFSMLMDCLYNKDALIMGFPSFEPSTDYTSWRKTIEYCANSFHRNYFKPPIPKDKILAKFTANPIDKLDARHFIQHMLSEVSNNSGSDKPKPAQVTHL